MRANDNPPDTKPPDYLDYEMWTGPAPMRPYNALVHPRGWRAFMEYGNGIVGDMCIHMLDMVRWMLDLGWPKRISSTRRHPGGQERARPTSPTRRRPRSTSATWTSSGSIAPGASRPTRSIPGARRSTATRARSRSASMSYDFMPLGEGKPIHRDVTYELRQVSRGQDREGPGDARRPGHPRPHEGLPRGDRLARQAGGRHRGRATSRRRAASWPTCR